MEPRRIRTQRLELIAATPESERAAGRGRAELADYLSCSAPADWPPPLSADVQGYWEQMLLEDPRAHGWTSWYWLLHDVDVTGAGGLLVGYGGFKGRPSGGECEVGYSVVESQHRRGLATEGVRALVEWALACPDVSLVCAHTLPELTPSIGVLEKLGFTRVGDGQEEGTLRYELRGA